MKVTGWLLILAVILVVAAVFLYVRRSNPPLAGVRTRVEMTMLGGFKYVYSPADGTLDIAFMKSTPAPCNVQQLGVDLVVRAGDIIEPANPPANKTFDPGGAVVTFGGASPTGPLIVVKSGPPGPPFHPANPNNNADWEDLHWLASVSPHYPGSSLNPNWKNMVDGRMSLTEGKVVALSPSDPVALAGRFQFVRDSDTTTFEQSVTDQTFYTVNLPGAEVVINLTGARSGVGRIVVRPVGGQPVRLRLEGKHTSQTAPTLNVGDKIQHFCAFYELLQPVPAMNERFIPKFIGDPGNATSAGNGSPGAYCPGDF